MLKEKNQNELTHPAEQEGMDAAESGNAQDMASSRKKIVDGIHEVFAGISQAFEGLAQMFEGVSEQMDGLGETAEYAEEEELLKPLKVMGAKTTAAGMKPGATVKKPRKTPDIKCQDKMYKKYGIRMYINLLVECGFATGKIFLIL